MLEGQNAATIEVIQWAITEVRPGALGQDNAPTRRPYVGYLPFSQDWNDLERGSLFQSDPNKCREAKMRPLIELFSDHY